MPATRRSAPEETRPTAPYSLTGASKPLLNALTVGALKSHLKHFHLPTTGNKASLVNRLHTHLQSLGNPTNQSQENATNSTSNAPGDGSNTSRRSGEINPSDNTTNNTPRDGSRSTTSPHSEDAARLPRAPAIYYSPNKEPPPPPPRGDTSAELAAGDDDRLSEASAPVQRTTEQASTTSTSQTNPTIMPPGQSATSLPKPALPSIPSRIKENIAKGEYIDFTTIVPKSMFGPLEPHSQSSTTRQKIIFLFSLPHPLEK